MPRILGTHYGKSAIPVLKVERGAERDHLFQAVIGVDTQGERIVDSYTKGDNSAIVPTDTMKNFVYALVLRYPVRSIEDLARHVAREHLRRYRTMSTVAVRIDEIAWEPLATGEAGRETVSPISFRRRGGEEDFTLVTVGGATTIESGLRGLTLLKTTDSAFSGYPVDEYTTLPYTDDRILATSLSAGWKLSDDDLDYRAIRARIKALMAEVFVALKSESGQQVAYEMCVAVLETCPEVLEMSVELPNLHCNLLDLSGFGLENDRTLYVPTEAPHGDLNVTVGR